MDGAKGGYVSHQKFNMDDFKKTISIQATNDRVYDALTNRITKWWTEMFEAVSNKQGHTFTIRFGSNVFKTFEVQELVINKKVIWFVTDSLIDIPDLKNKTEWINTKIVWEITSKGNQTELQLIHFGLTHEVECYSICATGWQQFSDSLKSYLEKDSGMPFKQNNTN
jgi:uncharacterized protein YndB with AHSA1/START domain